MAGKPIPVTLLTGFLGSGKTTLLNRLISAPEMSKALVIINEFGSIGLDHDLVAHSNEDDTVVEMASGCLCCTIKGDLQKTLKDAPWRYSRSGERWFDRVIIETTGLADPAPIIHTIMADEKLIETYRLAEIITMVDGVNGAGTLDTQPEALKQAAVADTILISKTDIANADVVEALSLRLEQINPAAEVLAALDSINPVELLEGANFNPDLKSADVRAWLDEEAYSDHAHHHHHDHSHSHDINRHDERISSVCITFDEPMPAAVFDQWFGLLTSLNGVNMLRVKGLIHMKEMESPLVIHGVQHVWHPPAILQDWPSDDRRSRIVFIMRDMEESDLRTALGFVTDRYESAELVGQAGLIS
ncbi:MAG: GTP-binding protein [Erythrobacter sp.]|uniref:CobW family GTP-binding protein n=1 Tax=Erythrobacter sp. TaxID=1042 RepID=UPI003297CB1A